MPVCLVLGVVVRQIPFEAVDVWVPLCNQDEEGSEVVLFHAGYFTNVSMPDGLCCVVSCCGFFGGNGADASKGN